MSKCSKGECSPKCEGTACQKGCPKTCCKSKCCMKYFILGALAVVLAGGLLYNYYPTDEVVTETTTTGAVMSVYTGSTGQDIVEVETGIKVGFTPAIPTPITSSIKEENNRVMRSYLWSERVSLPVGTGNNSGFITFATKKPVASNRDIFLAFNGKVIGHLKKDASLSTEANEYKYDVKKIPMVEGNRNLWNYVNKDGEVTVMAYVGDGTNYVTMVAIELD